MWAVRAKFDSTEGKRTRPDGQIGTGEQLEKAGLSGKFDAERTIRGRLAQTEQFGTGDVRLEFLHGTEAGTSGADADLKPCAPTGPYDRKMPGALRFGVDAARRFGRFGQEAAGERTANPDGKHGQETVQQQIDDEQPG